MPVKRTSQEKKHENCFHDLLRLQSGHVPTTWEKPSRAGLWFAGTRGGCLSDEVCAWEVIAHIIIQSLCSIINSFANSLWKIQDMILCCFQIPAGTGFETTISKQEYQESSSLHCELCIYTSFQWILKCLMKWHWPLAGAFSWKLVQRKPLVHAHCLRNF